MGESEWNRRTYIMQNREKAQAGVAFEIPVNLNSSMTFMAHTSSMSGKNIAYTINIAIPEDTVPSTPSTPDQTVITELSFKEGSELSMKDGRSSETDTSVHTGIISI